MTSESIEHVLQDYFVATHSGDAARVHALFATGARIRGVLGGAPVDWSVRDFVRRVSESPSAHERAETFSKRVVSIAEHGPLAVALTEVLVRGEPMVDAITLQRDDGGVWRIAGKLFAALQPLSSTTNPALRNEREVRVVRYSVAAPERSIEVFAADRLGAFAYQLERLDARDCLPSHDDAHAAALALLVRVAPDLVGRLALQWIEVHDEGSVRGVKVKLRQSDGRYAWVVVGAGGEPITFERDVVWSEDMGQRLTEQLLR
jgi:hypothetical protein